MAVVAVAVSVSVFVAVAVAVCDLWRAKRTVSRIKRAR